MSIVGVGCRATGPEFDREWFGISAADATGLDPRHRITLEIAVEALDDAGLGCLAPGSAAAVILGAAGFTTPNAARLLSRALTLHGPSLILDSEADTPLIAVDTGVRLLADESIPFVLAGGTDLTVLPDISGIELSGNGDLCTVLVLQRTADALRTGARRYADIDGPALGISHRGGFSRIVLQDNSSDQSRHESRDSVTTGGRPASGIRPSPARHDRTADAAPDSRCVAAAPKTEDAGKEGAGTRALRGPERSSPIPIVLSGPDAAAIRALALHWANRVGAYRDVHQFATAAARLLPAATRAVVLARDTGDAATQLRVLAARIPAATPEPTPPPEVDRRTGATALPPADIERAPWERHGAEVTADSQHRNGTEPAVPQADSGPTHRYSPRASTSAHGAEQVVTAGPMGRRAYSPAGTLPGRWDTLEMPALRWAVPGESDIIGPVAGTRDGGLLFLFSGSGFHPRMGRTLAGRYPVFARRLTEAADAVAAAGGPRVWTPRYGFGNHSPGLDFTQPAVFAYQVALAALLEFWGVMPDAVAGHGAGEIAAAVAAGALPLTDAARIVVARSRLLHRVGEESAAAVLEATPAEALRLVEPMRTAVGLAAIHGPSSVTVAGEPRYIDALVRRAHRRAIFAQRIAGNSTDGAAATVIHIPRARTIAPQLISDLDGIVPSAPHTRIYSTTRRGDAVERPSGAAPFESAMDAEYWGANAAGPVELAAALEQAVADGISSVIELSPQPMLATAVRDYGALRDATYVAGSAVDEGGALLRALAQLHAEGRRVDWLALGAHTATPPRRLWRRAGARTAAQVDGISGDSSRLRAGGDGGSPDSSSRVGQSAGARPVRSALGAASAYSVGSEPHWLGPLPGLSVRGDASYVVVGGLGAYGATAVRWLLDAGARDVVVLTRVPRALPAMLEGLEERVVMVRCEVGNRRDLAEALHDIRECGLPIRGIVYARPEPRAAVAAALGELTADDPIEFAWLLGDEGWRRMSRVSGRDGLGARE
ncbi:acyltransferase domain-containing protein [Nocardia inohanensis]|uniref:acyltransferase domain-containing protein n=1 Tax=Nocardia inohanensis TaxID=209246 RepID=UPI0008372B8A|nr:acyltransferase domain-containing protein [Nocardia inohanensis]